MLDYFFRKLYKLISYNRKIIVAAKEQQTPLVDCSPDYSFFWRWLLIIICYSLSNFLIVTSASVLFGFYKINLAPFVSACWMLLPMVVSIFYSKKTATDIHAHASVTATITGFLLLIAGWFVKYFNVVPLLFYLMLLLILIITLSQCMRRYRYMLYLSKR